MLDLASLVVLSCFASPTCGSTGLAPSAALPHRQAGTPEAREDEPTLRRDETVELVRVVSGDTFHVRRGSKLERVHLLSVDTEEPIAGRDASSMTKPQTPYGDACLEWTKELFRSLAGEDGVTRLGLHHPEGETRRDVYGRILCHVLLPDGEDLNLRLVREGRSPYYNKYGNSTVYHEAFEAAQDEARDQELGIWDPRTNAGTGPHGVPLEKRPYPELIAWWNARATAIDGFRARAREHPLEVVSAEDADALLRSIEGDAGEVEVFGEITALRDDAGGALRVVFRSTDPERSLSVLVPGSARAAHESLRLASRHGTFRQNFFYVRGRPTRQGTRFELVSEDPAQWRVAGPEPELDD